MILWFPRVSDLLFLPRLLALVLLEAEACTFSPKPTRAEKLCSFLTVGTDNRLFGHICVPELEAGADEATVHGLFSSSVEQAGLVCSEG